MHQHGAVRWLRIAGIAGLLLALTATITPPASATAARGCAVPNCHGAISFNTRTGEAGIALDQAGQRKAVRLAHHKCRVRSERGHGYPGRCERAGTTTNGCMAVAFRVDPDSDEIVEWNTRYGDAPATTRRKARQSVAGPGRVYVGAWLCTSRI